MRLVVAAVILARVASDPQTDSYCAERAKAFAGLERHATPRVAVLLVGRAFRNWRSRATEGSCCLGTDARSRARFASSGGAAVERVDAGAGHAAPARGLVGEPSLQAAGGEGL